MVTLYTTHCPKCNVLEVKLKQKNIQYIEFDDVEAMQTKGFLRAPILEVDGELLEFNDAVKYINSQETKV